MIAILNSEIVMYEMAELARLHIARLLNLEPGEVHPRFVLDGDRVGVEFGVDMPDNAGAWEKEQVSGAIVSVWQGWAKAELEKRLQGLGDRRGQ